MLFLLCSGIIKADCRACNREQRVSPDGGGTGPMLSGVHHPTDVELQGRVGAVPGLPLPRRLKGRGEKSTRLVAELFMLNPTGFATKTQFQRLTLASTGRLSFTTG